jgi:hypothetical protein
MPMRAKVRSFEESAEPVLSEFEVASHGDIPIACRSLAV